MRRKRSVQINFFSFLDILFSTMGILIFLTFISFLISSFEQISAENNQEKDIIFTFQSDNVFTKSHKKLEHIDKKGNPYWFYPIFASIKEDEYLFLFKGKKRIITDESELKTFVKSIGEKNCIRTKEGIPERFSFVFGIYEDGYSEFNKILNTIFITNAELKEEFKDNFFKLTYGKEALVDNELPEHWKKLWEIMKE